MIRLGTRTKEKEQNCWLYCAPCHEALFDEEGRPGVPFRDQTSAEHMRPDPKNHPRTGESGGTTGAPAPQPRARHPPSDGAERAVTGGTEPPPPPAGTSTQAQQAQWAESRRFFSRAPGGAFSHENLVPTPRPELWQDAPHSPLEHLRSPQAQGRLSVCQLISSMEESRVNVGVATYASSTGDVNFKRRTQPDGSPSIGRANGRRSSVSRESLARHRPTSHHRRRTVVRP